MGVKHVSYMCMAVHIGKGLSTPFGLVSALTPSLPNLGPQLKGAASLQTPSVACAALQPTALSRKARPQGQGQAPSQGTSCPAPQLESPPRFQSPCPPPTAPSGPSAFTLCPGAGLALCLLLLCPLCRQQQALSESPKTENKEAPGVSLVSSWGGEGVQPSSAWVLPPPPPGFSASHPQLHPCPRPKLSVCALWPQSTLLLPGTTDRVTTWKLVLEALPWGSQGPGKSSSRLPA